VTPKKTRFGASESRRWIAEHLLPISPEIPNVHD